MQPSDYTWPIGLSDPARWQVIDTRSLSSAGELPVIDGQADSNILAIEVNSTDDPTWYRAGWCAIELPNFTGGSAARCEIASFKLALNRSNLIQFPDPMYGGAHTVLYSVAFVPWLRSANLTIAQFI